MLHVTVVRPPRDTLQFRTHAQAHGCGPGRGVLIQGTWGGYGALLAARSAGNGMGGEYPLLTRGDTTTPRGAFVGVRFMLRSDDARGVTLDSGRVSITRTARGIDALASGSGVDPADARRVVVVASFTAVPLGPDSTNCAVAP